MENMKVKSVAKTVKTRGPELSAMVLKTMKIIADTVGATLGPGGMPVLIERPEYNMPGFVTKDGVTVFKSLGFTDPIAHEVMSAARDAAVRTVSEAGDGTTTATVLAEAIVRYCQLYCTQNPRVSAQRVVRRLETVFAEAIEPLIRSTSIETSIASPEGTGLLRSVARLSANGDDALAAAVMECFRLVGDEGNVTIVELAGHSHYEVERIEGFPVGMGYEDCCGRFQAAFINDQGNQRVLMERPTYVLYYGAVNDITAAYIFLMKIADLKQQGKIPTNNVVLVATGFSDSVLGALALNFPEASTLNVVPLVTPKTIQSNSEYHFLADLAAVTGAVLLDPLTNTFERAEPEDCLGKSDTFEMYRFRSTVLGRQDAEEVLDRVDQLQAQVASASSIVDKNILLERIGKITGGIARLKVIGASNGELKEKRDRAEDAVCAVRGAIKYGAVPGGGWMLLKLVESLAKLNDPVVSFVLCQALVTPVIKMLANIGMQEEEIEATIAEIQAHMAFGEQIVYDGMESRYIDAVKGGILDSTPAVLEAIRNSISIASLLGTLGGVVVFERDRELERRDSQSSADFLRNIGEGNEANNRP